MFVAGVWVGAGSSLSELQSLLEKMVPQLPEEKTELFRALIQQLRNLGSLQIRNVAVGTIYYLLVFLFNFIPEVQSKTVSWIKLTVILLQK